MLFIIWLLQRKDFSASELNYVSQTKDWALQLIGPAMPNRRRTKLNKDLVIDKMVLCIFQEKKRNQIASRKLHNILVE